MKQKESQKEKSEKESIVGTAVATRGQVFEGIITKKFPTRVVIEFERTVYIPKYERFVKRKTKIHARIPENLDVNVNDLVKARECRPLSKIIHFVVVGIVKKAENLEEKQ